jgi:hypothetical protein
VATVQPGVPFLKLLAYPPAEVALGTAKLPAQSCPFAAAQAAASAMPPERVLQVGRSAYTPITIRSDQIRSHAEIACAR